MSSKPKKPYDKRANMIDGLPSSFNVLFAIKSGKKCGLCDKRIKKGDISNKLILYTDEFEFTHKLCLSKNEICYYHITEEDLSSPVKLTLPNGKLYKTKFKKNKSKKQKSLDS